MVGLNLVLGMRAAHNGVPHFPFLILTLRTRFVFTMSFKSFHWNSTVQSKRVTVPGHLKNEAVGM